MASSITYYCLKNRFDFLFVYDGASETDTQLGMFTGNVLPDDVLSSGSDMHLEFMSDSTNGRTPGSPSGFSLYFDSGKEVLLKFSIF